MSQNNSEPLRIAMLQMTPQGLDQDYNADKAEEYCRKAKADKADIALMPEMWNIGYTSFDPENPEERKQWTSCAVTQDSPYFIRFQKLAKELDMAIAITYLETWPGAPRNTVSLVDRHGEVLFTYAKIHTCDFKVHEGATTPGEEFYVCDLDTLKGTVRVGAMICYDREHPESARILMLKGAEVILIPNACTIESFRLDQLKIRSWENAVVTVMTNYSAPKNGRSAAYNANGEKIIIAPEYEGVYMAEVSLPLIRETREKTIWGNAYRRPHRYGQLLSMEVEEPFTRKNAFGEPFIRAQR